MYTQVAGAMDHSSCMEGIRGGLGRALRTLRTAPIVELPGAAVVVGVVAAYADEREGSAKVAAHTKAMKHWLDHDARTA